MAYTYDNFVSAANAAGLMNQFSEQDLQIAQKNPEFGLSLLSLLEDNSNATTAEQQLLATEAANQLRKSYGVYNTATQGTDDTYAGIYGSQNNYQQLLDSLVNRQPFSYDLQLDPSWGSYKKAYMREGDRASANALAQASAASGGRASSYALTAAQQAGNYYAGQLADIIPTLEQNAYQRYLDAQNQVYQAEQDRLNQEQLAYENALDLYQVLGYATPEVAKVLGIKSGSESAENPGASAPVVGSTTDTGSDNLTVDMNSVLKLGYGPINETKLNELVESGEVKEVVDGNVIRFEKVEKSSTPSIYTPIWELRKNTMGANGNSESAKSSSGGTGSGSAADGPKSWLERVALLN